MKTHNLTKQELIRILEYARLAPSVHNSQPWKVQAKDNIVRISIDSKHMLSHGDPTGRQTIISLGIFTEAVVLASKALGRQTESVSLMDDGAKIVYKTKAGQADAGSKKQLDSLKTRHTDRSIYKPVSLSKKTVQNITGSATSYDVKVYVINDRKILDKIAEFTAKGIRLALSNPDFRRELSGYLTLPWSSKQRGISVRSLQIPLLLELIEPWVLRAGIGLGIEVGVERKRWLSASAVVFICADGDLHKHWFDAGRTYLHTSLAIEDAGLSQATSAAIVEASTFHEDTEELIGTNKRILSVLRVGSGSKRKHYSPRLSAPGFIIDA
jgi:nitroreductase